MDQNSLEINFRVTTSCNFNCSFCSTYAPDLKQDMGNETFNNILRLVNKINKKEIKLTFFGGEPTLSPYIGKYLMKANALKNQLKLKDVKTQIQTNMSNPKIIIKNIKYIDILQISIHPNNIFKKYKKDFFKYFNFLNTKKFIDSDSKKIFFIEIDPDIESIVSSEVYFDFLNKTISCIKKAGFKNIYVHYNYELNYLFEKNKYINYDFIKSLLTKYPYIKKLSSEYSGEMYSKNGWVNDNDYFFEDTNFKGWFCLGGINYIVINHNGDIFKCYNELAEKQVSDKNINNNEDFQNIADDVNKLNYSRCELNNCSMFFKKWKKEFKCVKN